MGFMCSKKGKNKGTHMNKYYVIILCLILNYEFFLFACLAKHKKNAKSVQFKIISKMPHHFKINLGNRKACYQEQFK